MTILTPAALEAEWSGNAQRRKRQTIRDLTAHILRELAAAPEESEYALLALQPHQLLKRRMFARHCAPMRAFVWRQAVLYTHPARLEAFMITLRGRAAELPGMTPARLEIFLNDLTFFQVITDNFNEDGFMSVALHVTQRVLGEIATHPVNLDWAVGLGQWLDERYQQDRDLLSAVEVVTP